MSLTTYFVPLAVALTGAFAMEAAASPQRPSLRPGDLAIRAGGLLLPADARHPLGGGPAETPGDR